MGTARRTTQGIQSEILTRISKANKSTSDDFVLITRRGSAMCTFAGFLWNYLNYSTTIWHLLRKETFALCIIQGGIKKVRNLPLGKQEMVR